MPVGVTVTGAPVAVSPEEGSFLIGGEPGAGTSVTASCFVAASALDPGVELQGIEGEAIALLDDLVERVVERYELLRAQELREAPDWWAAG